MNIETIFVSVCAFCISAAITSSLLSIHSKLNRIEKNFNDIKFYFNMWASNLKVKGESRYSCGWNDPIAEHRWQEGLKRNVVGSYMNPYAAQAAQKAYDEAREMYEKKKQEKQE